MGNIATNTDLQPKTSRMSSAVFGLLNAGVNFATQKYQASQSMSRVREMNEYNSPVEQVKRFKAAGLNTALMYGQVESGNQTAVPETPDYSSGVQNAFANALSLSAQRLEKLKIENDTQRVMMEKRMNDVNVALAGTQLEVNKENAKKIAREAIQIDENTKILRQQYQQNEKRFEKEMSNLDKDLLLKDWQISASWMDYEQKKFTLDKLMPLQQKYLAGQAAYEQVVGEMANELVKAEIFSKNKADLQSWLIGSFGKDLESLARKMFKSLGDTFEGKDPDTQKTIDKLSDDKDFHLGGFLYDESGKFGITHAWKYFTDEEYRKEYHRRLWRAHTYSN